MSGPGQKYVVAIDGGGTKTDFLLTSAEGKHLATYRGGGTSLTRRGPQEVETEMAAGVGAVFRQTGIEPRECAICCAGIAGAGNSARRAQLDGMLLRLLPAARITVLTDLEIAWWAATEGGDGIVVIAGTGSAALGRRGKREIRAGGLGPAIGDEGSADWIGRQASRAGLIPELDAPAEALVALLHLTEARPLLRRAGAELAALAIQIAGSLGWSDPYIGCLGSVFAHAAEVREGFDAALATSLPKARIELVSRPAVEGALLLALSE